MSTPIMAAANVLNNLLSSFFNHQSVKVTQQHKTNRAGIYADVASNGFQTFDLIAQAYLEYLQVVEQEQTKRRAIEAFEKEAIAKIEAQKEFLITYLNRSFDERAKNFATLFIVVDRALAIGDNEQLTFALSSITAIAKLLLRLIYLSKKDRFNFFSKFLEFAIESCTNSSIHANLERNFM